MVIVIASDIHGNFENLSRLVKRESESANKFLFLGDVVDYGDYNDENNCLDLIRNRKYQMVKGNHEEFVIAFHDNGERLKISRMNMEHLRGLPNKINFGDYLFTHSLPDPKKTRNLKDAIKSFFLFPDLFGDQNAPGKISACFMGHYHAPVAFFYDRKNNSFGERKNISFSLNDDFSYLINPGSLGEYGTYIIFDEINKTVRRESIRAQSHLLLEVIRA